MGNLWQSPLRVTTNKRKMKTNNVELQIVVNDKVIAEYSKDSAIYVEAKNGYEYGIRLKNHNSFKVKVVLGADGINVIDSKPIGDNPNEMGYVLDAGVDTIIKGYRVDNQNVASFKFVEGEKAYANKSKGMNGKTQGVISAKVYAEKIKSPDWKDEIAKLKEEIGRKKNKSDIDFIPVPYYPSWPRPWYEPYDTRPWITWCGSTTTANASNVTLYNTNLGDNSCIQSNVLNDCHVDAINPNIRCVNFQQKEENPFSLGSTFGKKVEQAVTEVAFEVGNLIAELAIYYTTKKGLESLGVEMKKLPKISKMPEAFPAAKNRYCEVPSGWEGV